MGAIEPREDTCSTPEGITASSRERCGRGQGQVRLVLNARRHHRVVEDSLVAGTVALTSLSTPAAITASSRVALRKG